MGNYKFLFRVISSLSVVSFVSCNSKTTQTEQRPNIVYIMSDDHACQAISAYGHGLNETPNIDRIAKEGILFTNACVTNSICAPSTAIQMKWINTIWIPTLRQAKKRKRF